MTTRRIQASEVRYRRLFETARDGILLLDAVSGRVVDVNRFMLELLQFPIEHFLGKELWEIGVFCDSETNKAAMATLQKRGSIHYDNVPLKHRSGRGIPVEFVSNVYREGEHNVIQCNVRDITERKAAAALNSHMAAIIEYSDDAIISKTVDGTIATWNPGAERMFGYAAEEVVGRPVSFLFPPDRLNEEPELLERLRRGERVEHFETVRLAKNGQRIEVSLTISPIKDSDGHLVGASKILRNITGRKRAELDLSKAKESAESANRAKSEFLANMSHEIRTPMTAIMGFTDIILQPNQSDAERLECVQIIRRNSVYLLELINGILDLSKIEGGQMTVESLPCEVTTLVADVVAVARPRALEKGLEFEVIVKCPIPRFIQTDPMRLRQILSNLLGNAIKFTPAGKITMTFCSEGPEAGHLLCVEVTDSGIGMTAEQIARLFRPFSQADESITRKFGGTGLGLTISRQLARLLGGEIEVDSKPGIGSSFTLRVEGGSFAAVEMLNKLDETMFPSAAPSDNWHDVPLHGRILLVEDGRDNQRLLSTHLRCCGAEVVIAENGQIGVDLEAESSFDLILMDMQMPVMDGYTATSKLRSRGCTIPIIALTANAMAEDRKKCEASGCSDYLTKPVEREVLLKAVSKHLKVTNSMNPPPNCAAPSMAACTSDVSPIRSNMLNHRGMLTIITEFVDGLPAEVRKMFDFLEQNEMALLCRVVHQLRGSGGGYGFDKVTESAIRAEESIKTAMDLESISANIQSLVAVIRRIDGYNQSRELADKVQMPVSAVA
jgi:PAS domain S-box-containing protein